jgi:hypothetical protein
MQRTTNSLIGIVLLLLLPPVLKSQACGNSQSGVPIRADKAVIQGASGATVMHVEDARSTPVDLKLAAGPFLSQTTHGVVPSESAAFSAGDGTSALPKKLDPGASTEVLATISNDTAVGVSVASIFNGGKCIGQLKAVRYDAPLNFSIEGDGSSTSPLRVQSEKDVVLSMKNNDDLTYSITPSLSLENEEVSGKPVVVGPNSTTLVSFRASKKWFDLRSWFRTNAGPLRLVIRLTPSEFGESADARALSNRALPVNAQLARFGPVPSQLISSGVVFVVLFFGGIASLAINSLLPNVLKKLSYKRKLQVLADGTSAVSVKVDSRLRVLLRLERNRLLKLLASSSLIGADAGDVFQQMDVGIAALTTRVTVAQRLDGLRNRFDVVSCSCPPSISDTIDCRLQDAADQLRTFYLTDKNVTAASVALDAAEQFLNTLNSPNVLAKDIAARHAQLLARVVTFSDADLASLKTSLPGIFQVLANSYDDTHPVLPANFIEVDDSIARVNVALDYAWVCATTTDPHIASRLRSRNNNFIEKLGIRDWRSLGSARELVRQMRQNVYPEDLIEDLMVKKACIMIDQQVARPYLPLELGICFDNHAYNRTQALAELTCVWDFDDRLSEKGWAICHFYQEPAEKTITAVIPLATLATQNQQAAGGTQSGSVEFTKKLTVRKASTSFSSQKWFAEGLRFGIAFFLALIGLIAGAQDQLAKLDVLPALIAVFLLGFGADTIKNILTQPAQTQVTQSPATAQ